MPRLRLSLVKDACRGASTRRLAWPAVTRRFAVLRSAPATDAHSSRPTGVRCYQRRLPRNCLTWVRRGMFIQTEPTPNPESTKFMPGETVLDESFGTGVYFRQGDKEISRSPLAKKLLQVYGVAGVFLGRDFITITKTSDIIWQNLKPDIFGVVMDHFAEKGVVMSHAPIVSDTTILDTDSEVVAMIKELIESRVRPAVQEDGGDIFYHNFDVESGMVQVRLAGSCSGCPSSSVTLKNGVENMLMHYIPEVKGIQQIEDDQLKDVNEREVENLESKLRRAGIPVE